jgi:hypothetical protein
MKSIFRSCILLLCAFIFSGCVSNQKGTILPGNNIGTLKKYYVVRASSDNRGVEKIISNQLNARGLQATHGEVSAMPADVDAVVTYQDKWMWDITMYMLQLDIQFRKPVSDIPMATGSSMRTSLIRKSPPDMVQEVLDRIFEKAASTRQPALGSK